MSGDEGVDDPEVEISGTDAPGADQTSEPDRAPARGRGAPAGQSRPDSDQPTLPRLSRDESEPGWGEDDRAYSDDWYRRERPPHHE